MDNLNPLFQVVENKNTKKSVVGNIQQPSRVETTITRPRKERSDKQHNVKFPTDHIFHMKLRMFCQQAAPYYKRKYNEQLAQTKFNTLLLRHVLSQHIDLVDWDIEYTDTKRYMHTNLLKSEYHEIGGPYGIAIRKGYSDRKTVYLMMRAALKLLEGGVDIEKII